MNNALRFSADNVVLLTIIPIGNILRWVVENKIRQEDRDRLQEKAGENLQILYKGGISVGGNGIGLSNCAEIVAAGFGIKPSDAVTEGYVGAKIIEDMYYGWFHWNAVQ